MKIGMETLRGLRYKLCMTRVKISGTSLIYGYNMSVIHNTQQLESTLKTKLSSNFYHAIRGYVAMKESLIGHVPSVDNPANIYTKVFRGGAKRKHLIDKVLHDLYKQ